MTPLNSRQMVSRLGSYELASGGKEWLFVCPTCKKRKLYVNPRTGQGFCQRCGEPVEFEDNTLDPWSMPLSQPPQEASEGRKWLGLPQGSYPLFSEPQSLPSASDRIEQRRAQRYLLGRGFDRSDSDRYDLHFCPGGHYQGRIIFPVTYRGVIWTFIARDYWGSAASKVLHPTSTGQELEHLALLGLDQCLESGSRDVVLVEGPFDAMSVGSPPGVALHGTSMKGVTLHLLLGAFDRFVLFLDPDSAGQSHAQKLFRQLQSGGKPVALIRKVPDDPAALGKEYCRDLVRSAFEALHTPSLL